MPVNGGRLATPTFRGGGAASYTWVTYNMSQKRTSKHTRKNVDPSNTNFMYNGTCTFSVKAVMGAEYAPRRSYKSHCRLFQFGKCSMYFGWSALHIKSFVFRPARHPESLTRQKTKQIQSVLQAFHSEGTSLYTSDTEPPPKRGLPRAIFPPVKPLVCTPAHHEGKTITTIVHPFLSPRVAKP